MSAAPQTRAHAAQAHARPKPKLVVRPRGLYHGIYRPEIVAKYQRSKWAGRSLSLNLHRVTSGCAQAAWLLFVYHHTSGSPDAKERKLDWSPVLLPEDAAKESGLGAQNMREACHECVALGFTPRKSTHREDGPDFYRFRVDFDKISRAPNAFKPREGAFVPRKPVQAAVGDEKANSADSEPTCEESRASTNARVDPQPQPLPAGDVAVVAVAQPTVELSHSLPCAVVYTSTLSDSGRPRIHLSSPAAAEAPSPAPGPTVVDSASGKVIGVVAPSDRTPPNPDQSGFPFSGDAFLDRMAELGTPVNDAMLARLQRERQCAEGFFLDELADAVRRAALNSRVITASMLPKILAEANQKWKNGGQKAWESRQASGGAPPVETEESHLQRRARELHSRKEAAND